jgi:hypothetical protein
MTKRIYDEDVEELTQAFEKTGRKFFSDERIEPTRPVFKDFLRYNHRKNAQYLLASYEFGIDLIKDGEDFDVTDQVFLPYLYLIEYGEPKNYSYQRYFIFENGYENFEFEKYSNDEPLEIFESVDNKDFLEKFVAIVQLRLNEFDQGRIEVFGEYIENWEFRYQEIKKGNIQIVNDLIEKDPFIRYETYLVAEHYDQDRIMRLFNFMDDEYFEEIERINNDYAPGIDDVQFHQVRQRYWNYFSSLSDAELEIDTDEWNDLVNSSTRLEPIYLRQSLAEAVLSNMNFIFGFSHYYDWLLTQIQTVKDFDELLSLIPQDSSEWIEFSNKRRSLKEISEIFWKYYDEMLSHNYVLILEPIVVDGLEVPSDFSPETLLAMIDRPQGTTSKYLPSYKPRRFRPILLKLSQTRLTRIRSTKRR